MDILVFLDCYNKILQIEKLMNNKDCVLTVLKQWNFKIKVLTCSASDEGPLLASRL